MSGRGRLKFPMSIKPAGRKSSIAAIRIWLGITTLLPLFLSPLGLKMSRIWGFGGPPFVHAAAQDAAPTPLWFQATGADDPATVENNTPFPDSQAIVNAQWTTPRYHPNPKVQAADILPVTWASDGDSYVVGDDGSIHEVGGTTVVSRILGVPPTDNTIPKIDFELLGHDVFPYKCPILGVKTCYAIGFLNVDGIFYAATFDQGYPIVSNHPPGHARIDYSPTPITKTSWVHGTENFPKPVDSGIASFLEVGRGEASHDGCPANQFPRGCIYAIVLAEGYQDPGDPVGLDQFTATKLYLSRMNVGTPAQQYKEVTDPLRWQWFAGFDAKDRPTWINANDPKLSQTIRSLSYPRVGRAGCAAGGDAKCLFWDEPDGQSGHVNYPHIVYSAVLKRYFLTFTDLYYRDFRPATESGPMVQGGSDGIVLEAPHPWGPWSFVARIPYLGSGTAYGPNFPVQWQGPATADGQDLWMIWAANFFEKCGEPMLVPADRCKGVYGMNLRRMHLTRAGAPGAVQRPWYDQEIGFASPGGATLKADTVKIVGNGNLASVPDAYEQFKDKLYHDAFHYVFQRIQGNGSIEAHLHAPTSEESSTGAEASAGLMVRESTYVIGQTEGSLNGKQLSEGDVFAEDARYAYLGVKKDGAISFQYRDENQVVRRKALPDTCSGGCFLTIRREGDHVTASYSGADHVLHEMGSHRFSRPLSASVTMGMVASSDSASTFPQYASYSGEVSDFRVNKKSSAK
jgi:hypothetical protein